MENNPLTPEEILELEKKRDEIVKNGESLLRETNEFLIEHAKGQLERGIISRKQYDEEVNRLLDERNSYSDNGRPSH